MKEMRDGESQLVALDVNAQALTVSEYITPGAKQSQMEVNAGQSEGYALE